MNVNFKKLKVFSLIAFISLPLWGSQTIKAADINSIMSLISAPIAGFSLPENMIAQARAYLLSHPDIDYSTLESKLSAARGVVQSAIAGKQINSLTDIVQSVTTEQRNAVIADLQSVAKEAKLSVSVDNALDSSNNIDKESVAVVDKETGSPVFTSGSIIKTTGRIPHVSLKFLKSSLFVFLLLIEIVFVFKYQLLKNKTFKPKKFKHKHIGKAEI